MITDFEKLRYYKQLYSVANLVQYTSPLGEVATRYTLYPSTNEDLSYLNYIDLKGKTVLTVCGSADQALLCIARGAKKVVCFDINPLSECWLNLKIAGASRLSYNECRQFFNQMAGENTFLNYHLYQKIVEGGPFKDSVFWNHVLADKPERRSCLFRKDGLKYERVMGKGRQCTWCCPEFSRNEIIDGLKENLKTSKIIFCCRTLKQLVQDLDCSAFATSGEKFDVMLFSNISDWYKDKTYESDVANLMRYLKPDGIVQMYFNFFIVDGHIKPACDTLNQIVGQEIFTQKNFVTVPRNRGRMSATLFSPTEFGELQVVAPSEYLEFGLEW